MPSLDINISRPPLGIHIKGLNLRNKVVLINNNVIIEAFLLDNEA